MRIYIRRHTHKWACIYTPQMSVYMPTNWHVCIHMLTCAFHGPESCMVQR